MAARTPISIAILNLRKNNKMTQTDLALKIGVSKAAVSQFEKGDVRPSFDTMLKISAVFDRDLTEEYHESRPLKEISRQEVTSLNEKAVLLELLQQHLDGQSLESKVPAKAGYRQSIEELMARAIALTQEAAIMRTYRLSAEPNPHRDYDDRLHRRIGCELEEAAKLIEEGRLRFQLIEGRPIVTEQAVRDFFGDDGTPLHRR